MLCQKMLGRFLMLGLIAVCVGCGGEQVAVNANADSQKFFDEATELFGKKEHAKCLPLLEQAIASKGLSADFMVQATMMKACCKAMGGDTSGAIGDLKEIEPGAPELDKLYCLMSLIYQKSGQANEAKEALAKAKSYNATIKIPAALEKWVP